MEGSSVRYDRVAVSLHWISVLLVALAYIAINMRGPHTDPHRQLWMSTHIWAGTLLWVVSVFRLAWRLVRGAPKPAARSPWFSWLSRLVHALLYLFVLIQPLLGMLIYNLSGKPVVLAGIHVSLFLVGLDLRHWHDVKAIHELIGNVFYGVIGVHAAAALADHFSSRDSVLRRMSFS